MLDHVSLNFDPTDSKKDIDTAKVFKHRTARTLYLLWRPGHLVGPGFAGLALQVGKFIDKCDPQTAEELAMCFPTTRFPIASCCEFSQYDIDLFCAEALPYFTGKKTVTYEIASKYK